MSTLRKNINFGQVAKKIIYTQKFLMLQKQINGTKSTAKPI